MSGESNVKQPPRQGYGHGRASNYRPDPEQLRIARQPGKHYWMPGRNVRPGRIVLNVAEKPVAA